MQSFTLSDQAVFYRIDTANDCPPLEGCSCDQVIAALLTGQEAGWFDLLGFVVLPTEVQLLIVPRSKAASTVPRSLQAVLEIQPEDQSAGKRIAFDAEHYREKVDCREEVQQRLKWMHLAPVRSRLATRIDAYLYSSANPRFRDRLPQS